MRRLSSRFVTVQRGMLMLKVGSWRIEVFRTVIWIAALVFLAAGGLWLWILLLIFAAGGFYVVSSRPAEIQELGPYLAVIGWTVTVIALGSDTAAEPFYLAAAQLLPVVFLASAIETSRFSIRGRDEPDRRVRLVLIYATVLGEAYCLDALASGKPSSRAFAIVVASLVAVSISLIADLIGRRDQSASKSPVHLQPGLREDEDTAAGETRE
jgi:hypothetical protein